MGIADLKIYKILHDPKHPYNSKQCGPAREAAIEEMLKLQEESLRPTQKARAANSEGEKQ